MPTELDLRPQILQARLDSGNPIDHLQKDQRTLEEIFRNLTEGKGASPTERTA